MSTDPTPFFPQYEPWRHGGWYVINVRHVRPDGSRGGCGCVSRNYPDKKWRIVCFDDGRTFRTRDEAAHAEHMMTVEERAAAVA